MKNNRTKLLLGLIALLLAALLLGLIALLLASLTLRPAPLPAAAQVGSEPQNTRRTVITVGNGMIYLAQDGHLFAFDATSLVVRAQAIYGRDFGPGARR